MNFLKKLVLPTQGKIHSEYINFIKYSFATTLCISAQTAISIDCMINTVSLLDESSRTFNYIGKDIIGQLGSLIFMSKVSNISDKDPIKFIGNFNLIQQSSLLLTCMCPILPSYFIFVTGAANILSNISFIGYGALNAKCIQTMEDNNIGEIYSKISIINTLGSSAGLIVGTCIQTFNVTDPILIIPLIGVIRTYTFKQSIKNII
jgi:hypothetical protein